MLTYYRAVRSRHESGFSMVELLVVVGIIAILTAVAVPMFINQRKEAVDTATLKDVKNTSDQVEAGLASYRTAQCVNSTTVNTTTGAMTLRFYGAVSSGTTCLSSSLLGSSNVILSKGTNMTVSGLPHSATGYVIYGWNTGGKKNANTAAGRISFISQAGGIQ